MLNDRTTALLLTCFLLVCVPTRAAVPDFSFLRDNNKPLQFKGIQKLVTYIQDEHPSPQHQISTYKSPACSNSAKLLEVRDISTDDHYIVKLHPENFHWPHTFILMQTVEE